VFHGFEQIGLAQVASAKPAAALVTRVRVEGDDDVEFSAPSKFIGGVYTEPERSTVARPELSNPMEQMCARCAGTSARPG